METHWIKGEYEGDAWNELPDGEQEHLGVGWCIVGAYGMVVAEDAHKFADYAEYGKLSHLDGLRCIYDATVVNGKAYFASIENWNDSPRRTFGEVDELLQTAEKLALIREEPCL